MKFKKIMKYVLLVVLLAVMGSAAGIYLLLRSSRPGEKASLVMQGLQSEVLVTWDRWGVPYLRAQNEEDLFLAAGYIQARERLWQMELLRRLARGRLAEIVGEAGLPYDIRTRVLGLPVAIERDFGKLPDKTRRLFMAYASGVNTYIRQIKWNWPPEFILLRFRPEPWTVEDSLSIKQLLAMNLAADYTSELARINLIRKAGPKAVELLEPGVDFLPDPEVRLDVLNFGRIESIDQSGLGSNNWVISGARTTTGLPLLTNDPHLAINVPPIWLEMGLECPEFKVVGETIPGVPLVIIGHNQHLAWGITSSYVDVQDLYIEKVEWDTKSYLRQGKWKPLTIRDEIIKIRGEKNPRTIKVNWTDEGPILNPFILNCELPMSLRWTLYEGDRTAEGLELINRANNWSEFCKGVELFENPSLNFVYADVAGNIGYYLSGKIPVRKKESAVYPYPGWREDSAWTGYLTPEEKPNIYNPPSGLIVTANNNIMPEGYNYYLGFDWILPDRKDRIIELLQTEEKNSLEKMMAIQNDVYSRRAARLKQILGQVKLIDPAAEEAKQILLQWSGEIKVGLASAIYEVFWNKLEELTFSDEFSFYFPDLARYLKPRPAGLEKILDQQDATWFDRLETPDRETRDQIIEKAMLESLKELTTIFGKNREKWDWARLHRLNYQHPLGQKWYFGFLNGGGYPMIGDSDTVRASIAARDYQTVAGASCRLIIDLSDFDRSLSVLTSGENGHFLSPHYQDQISLYLNGLYHPLNFSSGAINEVKEKITRLIPKSE
ncbi:MAG: penicillin acylase family protein [Acidobacteriota bacterium]|nr:penicillin acylase family protein [Acidobacteriota bacterium]